MSTIADAKVAHNYNCYNGYFFGCLRLYNVDKFYIMDNHLAAAWCWVQKIDQSKRYGLFHIDRHYDLLNNLGDNCINENRDILTSNDFNTYYSLKGDYDMPIMRFDNYIDTFNRLWRIQLANAYL